MSSEDSLANDRIYLSIYDLAIAFINFNTEKFVKISEDYGRERSVKLSVVLSLVTYSCIYFTQSFAKSAISLSSDPTQLSNPPIWIVIAIIFCVTLVAHRFVTKKWKVNSIINLSCILCIFQTIPWIIFSAVVLIPNSTSADAELLKVGQGQKTAAYGVLCGSLERRAEALAIGSRILQRARLEIDDLDNLTTKHTGPDGAGILQDSISRLSESMNDIHRKYELERREAAAYERSRSHYPIMRWALISTLVASGVITLLFYVNYGRIFYNEGKSKIASAALAFLCYGIVSILLMAYQSNIAMGEEVGPELSKIHSIAELRSAISQSERALEVDINWLHKQHIEWQSACPKMNNFGLW